MTQQRSAVIGHRSGAGAVEQAQMLQWSIGNQAMLQLIAQQASKVRNEPGAQVKDSDAARTAARAAAPSWDFSKIPIFAPGREKSFQIPPLISASRLPIQAKLKVEQVNDPLEHEADRVANQAMHMIEPQLQRLPPQRMQTSNTGQIAAPFPVQKATAASPCGGGYPRCQSGVNNDGPAGSHLPSEGQASIGPVQPYGPSLPPTVADDPITTQPVEPEAAVPAAPALPIFSALKLRQWEVAMKTLPNDPFGNAVFGATESPVPLVWTNLDVQPAPTVDGWVAHGELLHPIHWAALYNLGPTQQVDITDVNDGDITAQNYVQVANDLRPDSSGRPLRSDYFCSDLTVKHERLHVAHHYFYFLEEFREGVAWLNQHTARTAQQVLKLVERMRLRVESHALARAYRPAEEDAAYAAGRAAYQQRSDDIRAKGKAGGYP